MEMKVLRWPLGLNRLDHTRREDRMFWRNLVCRQFLKRCERIMCDGMVKHRAAGALQLRERHYGLCLGRRRLRWRPKKLPCEDICAVKVSPEDAQERKWGNANGANARQKKKNILLCHFKYIVIKFLLCTKPSKIIFAIV